METKESTIFKVLMFPWIAHGHISPYFELAKKLTSKNFHIFFCSTAINLNSIKKSFQESLPDLSIEFIELHLPHMPELPPHHHTTNGLPPNLMSTLMHAFQMSKTSFSDIIMNLKPDLIIYDIFQPWAAELASFHKVPPIYYFTTSVVATSYFYYVFNYEWSQGGPHSTYPFQEIFLRDYEKEPLQNLQSLAHLASNSLELSHEIVLTKTSTWIEGKYLAHFSSLTGKNMVPLGPLVQEPPQIEEDQLHILNWLDKKDSSSVVLVSFGSENFPSKEEREEIAYGLELSKVNFIWVLRFPEGKAMNIEESIPQGFLERTKERGLVVEKWAPQAKILRHPSIGGFLSHCGWGSTTESLYYGVPIIAMPMQLDQLINSRLLVEVGVGKEIVKDKNGNLGREEIAKVIEEVVGKNVEDVKRKAVELSQKLRMEEKKLVDEAIEKLQMICFKNMQQKQLAPADDSSI